MCYSSLYRDQPDQYPWANKRTASEESQWLVKFEQKENFASSTRNQIALFQHPSNPHKLEQVPDGHCIHELQTVLLLTLLAGKVWKKKQDLDYFQIDINAKVLFFSSFW